MSVVRICYVIRSRFIKINIYVWNTRYNCSLRATSYLPLASLTIFLFHSFPFNKYPLHSHLKNSHEHHQERLKQCSVYRLYILIRDVGQWCCCLEEKYNLLCYVNLNYTLNVSLNTDPCLLLINISFMFTLHDD